MNTALHGLKVDYVNRHGHFLVLSGEPALTEADMSAIPLHMLRSNDIPGLLPVTIEELNGQITLYYPVSGKKPLSQVMRQSNLRFSRYVQIMLHILNMLDESKTYMLFERQYVLNADYIFVGESGDLSDLYVVYIPVVALKDKKPVETELQQLAATLLRKTDRLDGIHAHKLTSYLLEDHFQAPGFKKMLLEQVLEERPEKPPVAQFSSQEFAGGREPSFSGLSAISAAAPSVSSDIFANLPKVAASKSDISPPFIPPPQPPDVHSAKQLAAEAPVAAAGSPLNLRIPILVSGGLGSAIVWKWYMDRPQGNALYVAAGATAVITAAVIGLLLFFKKRRSRGKNNQPQHDAFSGGLSLNTTDPASAFPPARLTQSANPFSAAGIGPANVRPSSASPRNNASSGVWPGFPADMADIGPGASARNAEQYTTLLAAPADATVLLDGGHPQGRSGAYLLEQDKSGATKRIAVSAEPFVIGRGGTEAGVQHTQEVAGVSRQHVEIGKSDGEYTVKDLGSKNGTVLNGQQMIPFKVYSLREGDIFKVVQTEYTFKMGL
ncbi:DUF6382 domain-containing protein [Paenibacillus thalictri]|uniref:FHA domain-containing protein n=1 Tax=Paenibacillus thalictri TaxID=2527873 RepID=A0A4Q9DYC9_9BACL|nr:DUF6382 domain-containing protein [Paenibacillus thalictri]TBL80250.1 FHA domain-containing protein [Paenibacillus thalictri]